jgi:hypothetical protein
MLPRDTYTKAHEGESAVERPSVPWVVEVLTTKRETGTYSK